MSWYNNTYCKDRRRLNPGRFPRKVIDEQTFRKLYYAGRKNPELASYFNCSIATVKRHIKILIPVTLRKRMLNNSSTNPINQRIIRLYTNHHYSTLKIAGIIGLSDETIRTRLHSLGIQMRSKDFKNLELFHPKTLNRHKDKQYPISDLNEFNHKFHEYYCLMYSNTKIAELLQIDRATVKRRIDYLNSQHYFKMRFCKRCGNLYRFRPTERQRNSKICPGCRKDAEHLLAFNHANF